MKKAIYNLLRYDMELRLFDATNVSTSPELSGEMKTYYSDYLIDNAEPELVHDQFGQKHPIPKNRGKVIEFRKFDPLPKITKDLVEGVTPTGQKLSMGVITSEIKQYGGYVEISDVLDMTAIDNNMIVASELLGSQAGRSLDTITREVLNGGTNIQYAEGQVSSRAGLYYNSAEDNCNLTVDAIRRAVRYLRVMNARPIGDSFVAVIHPDCAYDLMRDPEWQKPHEYVDTENLYNGEIGKIAGCRFVQTTEAKKWVGEDLSGDSRTLTVNGAVSNGKTVNFDGGTVAPNALAGRRVLIGSTVATVESNTATALTLDTAVTAADNAVIYPGEGGKDGRDIYSVLVLAKDAYGVTEVTGGGLEFIAKQLGSGGTTDPLNQRATSGWKATKTAERLVEAYMVRVECTSTFNDHQAN